MPGSLAVYKKSMVSAKDRNCLLGAINLADSFELDSYQDNRFLLSVAQRPNRRQRESRKYENKYWVVLYSGDILNAGETTCLEIANALETEKYDSLAKLDGTFSIIAFNKTSKVLYGISDRRSQQPIYHYVDSDISCISTELSVFCRLMDGGRFNSAWLWQYLYFNFPITENSFIHGVERLPPASIIRVDPSSTKVQVRSYADLFTKQLHLLKGNDGLRRAAEVFSERVPEYFSKDEEAACALTGGWDGRTMLALAPQDARVTAYTYGCNGCGDLLGGAATARSLGVDHIPIVFDESFTNSIPDVALKTVYLSSGQQGVLRSSLYHVYKELTHNGAKFPLSISGISLDMQFRGHAHRPNLISDGLARLFEGREFELDEGYWRQIAGAQYGELADTINSSLSKLKDTYGEFADPEHHLRYIVYELSPKYFSGELSVSDYFTTVRVPSWDNKIIELAFAIEQSTLNYSQFLANHKRGSREEMILQAYIFRELAPHYFSIPVRGRRPADILSGEFRYKASRAASGVIGRLTRSFRQQANPAPLEDWHSWLFTKNPDFVNDMLDSSSSLITQYIRPDFIRQQVDKRDLQFVGKLITAEIILRLLRNQWHRFW